MKPRSILLLFSIFVLAFGPGMQAQAPSSRKIPFNNVATNLTCAPDPSPCQRNIILRMYNAATEGTPVGVDEPQTVSVDDPAGTGGSISFVLGSTRPMGVDPGDFQAGSSRYLDVLNAATGGSVLPSPPGRIEQTAVAFAVNPGPQGAPGVVQAVSAADSSIMIGGTAANPTVAVGTVPSGSLSGTYSNSVTFSNTANAFAGNGAALTGLNASNLTSGAVPDARLSNNVALRNAPNVFTAPQTVAGNFTVGVGGVAFGDGGGLTNLKATNLTNGITVQTNGSNPPNIIAGFSGNTVGTAFGATVSGGGSAGLAINSASGNFATVSGGTQNNASGVAATVSGGRGNTASGEAATVSGGVNNTASGPVSFAAGTAANAQHNGAFVWSDGSFDGTWSSTAPRQFLIRASGNVGIGTNAPSQALEVAGKVKATSFVGSGAELTSINVTGLAAGTYPNAYTFSNTGNLFTGNGSGLTNVSASGLVGGPYGNAYTFSNTSNSFTGSGAALTSLNASSLTSGVVPDARLSSNVALRNGANLFTGNQSIIGDFRTDGFSASSAGLIDVDAPFIPGGRLRILTNGNVGIGAVNPQQKLSVAGVIESTSGGIKFPDGTTQTTSATGGGSSGPAINPQQVALLKWYSVNQTTSFTVGVRPFGVAFDGANIWVANYGSGNVSKLRASDGASLGTFSVGTNPWGVAFDGANIWVANYGSGNVSKLRASDGASLGTFSVGTNPIGVAFDGANIWVANNVSPGTVTKLRASDGASLGTFSVGNFPYGVAFDGANIWVTNNSAPGTVTKLRASDGASLGTFSVGNNTNGVAFDGANIWVANYASSNVSKVRASDGTVLGNFAAGAAPNQVAFDGANIWVTNYVSPGTVTKLRASDGALLGTFSVGDYPTGVAFDGANIWVAASNAVNKL